MKRNRLFTFVSVLVALVVISSCASQIALNVAVKRNVNKDKKYYEKKMLKYTKKYPDWTPLFKDTTMVSPVNQVKLHAIYMPAAEPTTKTAFILHGHTVSAPFMLTLAHWYSVEMGYNVFLPDFQAHGLSEGKIRHMGWFDRFDFVQWLKMANDIFKQGDENTQIVVTGMSMGGASTMIVGPEVEKEGLDFVKCFVEDCGYSDFYEESAFVAKSIKFVPKDSVKRTAMLDKVDQLCLKKYGWSFKQCSAVEQVKRCSLPVLFIHGGNDTYVPTSMVYVVYDAKTSGDKEIFVAPDRDHCRAIKDKDYFPVTKKFLEKYIK